MPPGGTGTAAWSPSARAGRHTRDAGHHPTLASRDRGAEVDLSRWARPSRRSAGAPSSAGDPDGYVESDVGLHADSGGVEERRALRRPVTIARILRAAGNSARSAAPHDLAHTFLQAHSVNTRGGRLLHDRGLDRPRTGDVLRWRCCLMCSRDGFK